MSESNNSNNSGTAGQTSGGVKTLNAWDLDLRVRERNLRTGAVTEKDLEKMRATLPDLEENVESVTLPQPAIGGREGS
jgi:hypothetical protein